MKTEIVKEDGPCRVTVSTEVTAEEVAAIRKRVNATFAKRVRLPGFRPGKAPMARIEALYGKDIQQTVNQEIIDAVISDTQKFLDEQGREMARVVDLKDFQAEPGQAATLTATLDLSPRFDLPEETKWQVKKVDAEVTDEMLEARLADVRKMAASFRNAEGEETAAEDDLAEISFTSNLSKDGLSEVAARYVSDEGYWLQLHSDTFIPGLAEALRGKKVNDAFALDVTYPADFRVEDLANKAVHYDITLKTLRKYVPADDAAVVARFNAKDMDEVRQNVKDSLGVQRQYEEGQRALNDLINAIDASVSFELPESVVDRWTYDELYSDATNPLERFKDDPEGLRKDPVYAQAQERATKRLRRNYTLLAVAKARDIKLTGEEMDGTLNSLADRLRMPVRELVRRLRENGRLNQVIEDSLCQKVLNELVPVCAVL